MSGAREKIETALRAKLANPSLPDDHPEKVSARKLLTQLAAGGATSEGRVKVEVSPDLRANRIVLQKKKKRSKK